MFGPRYFRASYFGPRYFGHGPDGGGPVAGRRRSYKRNLALLMDEDD